MRLAWAVFAAFVAAGTAFAQAAMDYPPIVFREALQENDLSRAYPRAAWSEGQEGRAILCCLVTESDGLACAAVAESPAGAGFGEAARIISMKLRLTPDSAAQWREHGGVLRLPMSFRVPRNPIAAPPLDATPECGNPANFGQ